MKTYNELTAKMHRASMRESALRFRQMIHPRNFIFGTEARFVFNTEMAVEYLTTAIGYRDMAKEVLK